MMAEKKRTQRPARRRRKQAPAGTKTLAQLWQQRKKRDSLDFKPDVQKATWVKTNKLTRQQQLRLTKWVLYALTVVVTLVFYFILDHFHTANIIPSTLSVTTSFTEEAFASI